jgi:hypothetical protein
MAYGNGYDLANDPRAAMGGCVTTSPPPRIPAIQAELQRMQEASERLHKFISELESRISAVTRPDGPGAACSEKQPIAPVALAGGLSELNSRFETACARLHSLLERIEL